MNQRPDFRRNGSPGSDTSSFYSVRTGSSGGADSACSVWSSSESDSYVWREDPWGFDGVGGAVTRFIDERDDRRRRFASHFLSGPFAQFYKKSRKSSSGRSGRSTSRSSGNPGMGNNHHFVPRPGPPGPAGPAGPPFQQEQFRPGQFRQQNFGPPPPPPPPVRPAGVNAGFEAGFIQLGGGGNGGPPPPPQHPGDPWNNAAGYGAEVYD
ncbi:hypothetical protein F4818DRAFT_336551 [Hypoxylon cercidicola]|nr:hypothetical protein F4818DRAFT_336551 [Hypoxylon cercidicola]